MELTERPVYLCPICRLETLHKIMGHLDARYGICCTNCGNGSLVGEAELHLYQLQWEEELQSIIRELGSAVDRPSMIARSATATVMLSTDRIPGEKKPR